ncbi:hypothetical protein OG523_01200 [Streptomyces virginiae]|uniref:hypothetical protein n=1 Tax=Streptomyces virginiae TaxID=1961 RepID=UPI002E372625|nr:hypothetical protein [Streptomyces virginiae]
MPSFSQNNEQAKMAWSYYAKGDRTIAFDPASRSWVPVGGGPATSPDGDAHPGGLSEATLARIAPWTDAVRQGIVTHDDAQVGIIKIIREVT